MHAHISLLTRRLSPRRTGIPAPRDILSGSSNFSPCTPLSLHCHLAPMTVLRSSLRSVWGTVSRPMAREKPHFFRPSFSRTLINSSRDNHWPRSPVLPGGKGFNWDAFRWTNYRVASFFVLVLALIGSVYGPVFWGYVLGRDETCTIE